MKARQSLGLLIASPNAGWAELIPLAGMFLVFLFFLGVGAVGIVFVLKSQRFRKFAILLVPAMVLFPFVGTAWMPDLISLLGTGRCLLSEAPHTVDKGMSREDVISAIGKPHKIYPDFPVPGSEEWIYYLAPLGTTSYHVQFDANQLVLSIHQHL